MEQKQFQKTVEDFTCERCGKLVKGTGYTNHCPQCLYSKHVDVNPGDRAATCGGMMAPVSSVLKNGEYFVLQKCERCGHERSNAVKPEDNFDAVIALSKKQAGLV